MFLLAFIAVLFGLILNYEGIVFLQEYPFKTTTRHGVDYIRQFPHLRARTRLFSSVLRIRQTAAMAIHEFFQRRGYLLVHTPVLTSSDCEGAGEVFQAVVSMRGARGGLGGLRGSARLLSVFIHAT